VVPPAVLREALVNAVVDADYLQRGAPIRMAVFDDRVEVESPGVLLRESGSATRLRSGDPTLVDEILPVGTSDAKEMARRLAREESLFAGTSSGANVVAAFRSAERLGPEAKVVTLMVDSGLKYSSTDLHRNS
jgi:cysteine synthase